MFEIELPKKKTRIWDLDVPIISAKNSTLTEVYIHEEIMEPSVYNELAHKLGTATSDETFIIHLNTPGGLLDSANLIVNAIQNTEANTVASLTGTVASAGTIIALACDDIVVSDYVSWMTHNYSGGMAGKGHEMKAHQKFVDKNLNDYFKAIHAGFFTEDEIEDIIDGKDMWLGKDEILERWASKVSISDDTEDHD